MSQNKPTIDTLMSENYSLEQSLNHQNRKLVRKMFQYIRTYPLGEYEIELIRKDILGMAAESEERKESFSTIIDKEPKEFCNDLLDAIGGIKVPKGRTLLRVTGWYYQIIGWCSCIFGGFSISALLLGLLTSRTLLSGEQISIQLVYGVISTLFTGVFFIISGNRAKQYSGDITKYAAALKWGIIVVIFTVAFTAVNNIARQYLGLSITASVYTPNEWLLLGISSILSYVFPVLYIAGAYMNKKSMVQSSKGTG